MSAGPRIKTATGSLTKLLTYKCFGTRHAFMSTDSIDSQTDTEWKKRNMVLDMNNLVDIEAIKLYSAIRTS